MATHMYLGGIKERCRRAPGTDAMEEGSRRPRHTPQQLWEKSFSKHARNLFLLLCGDQSISITHRQTSQGMHGNLVYELLADYPRDADDSDWLRLLRFVPAKGQVEVFTYSPAQDRLCEAVGQKKELSDHQFTLDISTALADYEARQQPAAATPR